MEEKSNKSYILVMGIGVLCLGIIIFTASYAYFSNRMSGNKGNLNVKTGSVDLKISETKITAPNLAPINEDLKETKAAKNTFTISLTDDSNLGACYTVVFVVDSIGNNLKNKWFKYEFVDGSNHFITGGNFADKAPETAGDNAGKIVLPIASNQQLTTSNKSKKYTLKLWLSYSDGENQSTLLTGNEASRTFTGHVYASGIAGNCS